jgi:hypothetical protein
VKEMPLREEGGDEIYRGLRDVGRAAVSCLLTAVTNATLMKDPRQAPFYSDFAVEDAAVFMITEICEIPIEEVLPVSVHRVRPTAVAPTQWQPA